MKYQRKILSGACDGVVIGTSVPVIVTLMVVSGTSMYLCMQLRNYLCNNLCSFLSAQ